jgi:AcrR family transcriptional regulator
MAAVRTYKQTERGAATRRVLLDSTTECLVQRGFGGASTTAICGEAGLTAGALFGQFPSKTALLVEVAADLMAQAAVKLAAAFDDLPVTLSDALVQVFDNLIRLYQTPLLKALSELWTAARTDGDLARALVDANAAEGVLLADLNRRLLSTSAPQEFIPGLAAMLMYVVSGQTTVDDAAQAARTPAATDHGAALRETVAALGAALDRSQPWKTSR